MLVAIMIAPAICTLPPRRSSGQQELNFQRDDCNKRSGTVRHAGSCRGVADCRAGLEALESLKETVIVNARPFLRKLSAPS